MKLKFASILNGSDRDYAGKKSSVVFTGGCPLRCGFCFSAPIIIAAENCIEQDSEYFVEYFQRIKADTDAVVFEGGEPLMQSDALLELCKKLKAMGFSIKIGTSGFYPEALQKLLPFVDYVAMDLKTEINADKYAQLTRFKGEPGMLMQEIFRSTIFLKEAKKQRGANLFVEFRTTIIRGVNDSEAVVENIAKEAAFADQYVLQEFDSEPTLVDDSYKLLVDTPKPRLVDLAEVAKKFVPIVKIRTKHEGEQLIELESIGNTVISEPKL